LEKKDNWISRRKWKYASRLDKKVRTIGIKQQWLGTQRGIGQ